jgi:hypothetical protein
MRRSGFPEAAPLINLVRASFAAAQVDDPPPGVRSPHLVRQSGPDIRSLS